MITVRTLSLVALLGSAALAQSPFTSPAGYLTTEGRGLSSTSYNGYSNRIGAVPNMRYQMVDAELRSKGRQTLTALSFRANDQAYTDSTGAGRSWTDVKLALSDGDFAAMGRTFTANQTSTPTLVFDASVTWPARSGAPSTKPAAWSYRFPFRSSFVYTATADLCVDWTFTGGKLANGKPWAANGFKAYVFDGVFASTSIGWGPSIYRYAGADPRATCADPAITRSGAYARSYPQVITYSKAYDFDTTRANSAYLFAYGYDTAPNADVIHAFNLRGTTPGVAIGAKCYNLMIDTVGAVIVPAKASSTGLSRTPQLRLGSLTAWKPLGRTVSFWSQCAWSDSKTGQLSLSAAGRCTPDFGRKMDDVVPKRKSSQSYSVIATVGSQPTTSFTYNPLIRFN